MEHSKEATASLLPEPPNGTKLVVFDAEDMEARVIVRDDTEAGSAAANGERWFDLSDAFRDDPMDLHQFVKHATHVYALSAPVASFVTDRQDAT